MVKNKKEVKSSGIPMPVKVLSILYYIGAALGVIFGILMVVGAGFMATVLKQIPMLAALSSGLLVVGGIAVIILSVVDFFVAKGLSNGKNWARILVMVFCAFGIISGVTSLSSSWFSMIVNLAIGLYLYLNKEVKAAFA